MHANNETGAILDLETVAALSAKHDAIFHCDTVQTVGHYQLDPGKLLLHLMTCAAHKLHGPTGIGFLYVNSAVTITPLMYGGAQERNMRGGDEKELGRE